MNNALKWGVIYGIVLSIFSFLSYFLGFNNPENQGGMSWAFWAVSFLASIFILVKGIQAFRDSNGGYMSLGNGVVQGLVIGLVGGLIAAIATYLIFGVMDPDSLNAIKEQAMAGAGETEGAEQAEGILNAMLSPGAMAGMEFLSEAIFGLIVGLIGGAVMKKDRSLHAGETL